MKHSARREPLDLQKLAERPTLDILVLSDTHGSLKFLPLVLQIFPRVDLILHLGDHSEPMHELTRLTTIPILGVAGNCDGHFAHDLPQSLRLCLAGYSVFLTHGHRFGVKHGLDELIAAAAEPPIRADLILFGHTHHYYEQYGTSAENRSFLLLNPGSACLSTFNRHPTCSLVQLSENGIKVTKFSPFKPEPGEHG